MHDCLLKEVAMACIGGPTVGSAVQLCAASGFAYLYVYAQYGHYGASEATPVPVVEENKFRSLDSVFGAPTLQDTGTDSVPQWQGQITDHYWQINCNHLHLAGLFACAIVLMRTMCSLFWICSVFM